MSSNNYELVKDLRDIKLFLNNLSTRIALLEEKAGIYGTGGAVVNNQFNVLKTQTPAPVVTTVPTK